MGGTKTEINGAGTEGFTSEKIEDFFTEVLAEKEIKIYTNPTRGQLRVDILGYEDLSTNSSIQVFASGGNLIYRTNILSQTNNINLSDKLCWFVPHGNCYWRRKEYLENY